MHNYREVYLRAELLIGGMAAYSGDMMCHSGCLAIRIGWLRVRTGIYGEAWALDNVDVSVGTNPYLWRLVSVDYWEGSAIRICWLRT